MRPSPPLVVPYSYHLTPSTPLDGPQRSKVEVKVLEVLRVMRYPLRPELEVTGGHVDRKLALIAGPSSYFYTFTRV
jgi:hypothetical protein